MSDFSRCCFKLQGTESTERNRKQLGSSWSPGGPPGCYQLRTRSYRTANRPAGRLVAASARPTPHHSARVSSPATPAWRCAKCRAIGGGANQSFCETRRCAFDGRRRGLSGPATVMQIPPTEYKAAMWQLSGKAEPRRRQPVPPPASRHRETACASHLSRP